MYITSSLSVSRKERLNCEDMAIFLSKAGVFTSITSNISTNPHIEYGCRLTQTVSSEKELQNIWTLIKEKYNFTCGHLKLGDSYEGCILNYLRPSSCPTSCD